MGEIVENQNYSIKEDGTIVRNRVCPHCGKESSSTGEYCEHCGRKLPKSNFRKGAAYDKDPGMIALTVLGTLFFGVVGIWCAFRLNGVIDTDGVLHYRYNKTTRRWSIVVLVLSVVSTIFWFSRFFRFLRF